MTSQTVLFTSRALRHITIAARSQNVVISHATVFHPALFDQPIRTRHVPDPGTLEQRLFRAVTQPVIPPLPISPNEIRLRRAEERKQRFAANPYRKFLIERAREDFFGQADGRMMLIIQAHHHFSHEFHPIENQLFANGMVFRGFPVSILKEAAKGTRWEAFVTHVLHADLKNKYLFADADPEACRKALNIIQKAPFLLLLGGVIGHRIMNIDQLKQFAQLAPLGGIQGVRSVLVATLEACSGQTLLSQLSYHQTELVGTLEQLSKSNKVITS